jgi:hypothetical protein
MNKISCPLLYKGGKQRTGQRQCKAKKPEYVASEGCNIRSKYGCWPGVNRKSRAICDGAQLLRDLYEYGHGHLSRIPLQGFVALDYECRQAGRIKCGLNSEKNPSESI